MQEHAYVSNLYTGYTKTWGKVLSSSTFNLSVGLQCVCLIIV